MKSEARYDIATVQHAEKISEIFNENILQGGVTLWQKPFSPEDIKSILIGLENREKAYIVSIEDAVIGWGWIRKYHDKEGYATTCETSVFFRRAFVNRGYGTPFKTFIIKECKRLGYHHIHAKIIASNDISIAYNLKLGYSIVGTQKEVGCINGQWVDVVIMQLLI